jgi:predicted ABC-type ATPase
MPIMFVVAGPAGSGKSTAFPGDGFGCDYFNADNYAAMLNGGSYVGIPKSIRGEVGPICERFIQDHIATATDFATETTLRSPIVFDQMKKAHDAGFEVQFTYVCVDSVGTSVKRVTQRAYQGGHSGSEDTILDIRLKSLGHLLRALNEMGNTIDILDIFDNSALDSQPRLVASFQARQIIRLDPHLPAWLTLALENTLFSTPNLLSHFQQKQPIPAPNLLKS